MKKYDELTAHGKKLRLRKIIEIGLQSYELDIKSFRFFEEATNMLYKLVDVNGTNYMLKVFDDVNSTLEDNWVEVFMIDACRDLASVPVPNVLAAKNGDEIISITSKYSEEAKRMIIYQWVDGHEFDEHETDEGFIALGNSMAVLHEATEKLSVPEHIKPKVFNKVYYFKDEKAVYKEDQYQKFLSPEYHEMMDKLVPFVDQELSKLYNKPGVQLIHGDINPWNILVDQGNIQIIDFEDTSLGYPIQDLGITLFYYRFDDNFDYEKVKKLLFEGYKQVRPLPDFTDFELEVIMMARRLNFMNYILLVSDDPKNYIETNVKRIYKVLDKIKVDIKQL